MSNVVQFRRPVPTGTSTTFDGEGPETIHIKITLTVDERAQEEAPPAQGQSSPVKVGGFWTGVIAALTLIFLGVM